MLSLGEPVDHLGRRLRAVSGGLDGDDRSLDEAGVVEKARVVGDPSGQQPGHARQESDPGHRNDRDHADSSGRAGNLTKRNRPWSVGDRELHDRDL
jgi:hypothetical protein